MKYNMVRFEGGKPKFVGVGDAEHLKAFVEHDKGHTLVWGEKILRYKLGRIVSPKTIKVYKMKSYVTLMMDTLAEAWYVENVSEVYQKCTDFVSAVYANQGERLNDITAYLGEVSGLRDMWTSPKILSGSATNATWKVVETPLSTEKYFGYGKFVGTDGHTWCLGLVASLSKYGGKLTHGTKAKFIVNKLPRPAPYPGVNPSMVRLEGKVITATLHSNRTQVVWKGGIGHDWFWLDEWLTPVDEPVKDGNIATVKQIAIGTKRNGTSFVRDMTKSIGKKIRVKKFVGNWYKDKNSGYLYHASWLEFEEGRNAKSTMEGSRKADSSAHERGEKPSQRTTARRQSRRGTPTVQHRDKTPRESAGVDTRCYVPSESVLPEWALSVSDITPKEQGIWKVFCSDGA